MRRRILTVLGLVVGLLAIYTLAFRVVRADDWTTGARAAADRLTVAASQATGSVKSVGTAAKQSEATPATEQKSGDAVKSASGSGDVVPAAEPEVWGSDPFVRDWVLVNELAELSLKAITMGGERAYALINDQILEEGDQISGKRIVKIEADKVILEQGGRTFNLLLGE
ncbi:MAG: hypothetical protein ABIL25_06970 [candidate division WOR-3 bacterium]